MITKSNVSRSKWNTSIIRNHQKHWSCMKYMSSMNLEPDAGRFTGSYSWTKDYCGGICQSNYFLERIIIWKYL